MGRSIHYQFGPYHFNSRKAAEGAIKKMLQVLPGKWTLSGPELEIVQALFKHSPKAPDIMNNRGGVMEFIISDVSRNDIINKRFMVICGNGNKIDFSAKQCLDNYRDDTTKVNQRKKKAGTFYNQVYEACREAIEEYREAYRNDKLSYWKGHGADICPISHQILTNANAVADHDDPYPFIDIVDMFVKSLGFDVDTLDETAPEILETLTKNIRTRFVNEDARQKFREFHNKYAKFRLITREANAKRVAAQKARRKEKRQNATV